MLLDASLMSTTSFLVFLDKIVSYTTTTINNIPSLVTQNGVWERRVYRPYSYLRGRETVSERPSARGKNPEKEVTEV